MVNEISLGELVDIPADAITDEIAEKYNGTKVKIKTVTTGVKKTRWKDGKQLPEGQFVEQHCAFVETEVFGIDAKGQPLSVKESFPLKQQNGKIGFSQHDKAKGRRFFKMLKINRIEEAIGREVVVVKTTFGSGRSALIISIP